MGFHSMATTEWNELASAYLYAQVRAGVDPSLQREVFRAKCLYCSRGVEKIERTCPGCGAPPPVTPPGWWGLR